MIYARVVTEDLNDSKLSAQVNTCRQYADACGLMATEEHIIAEAYSGITLKRPRMEQVRKLMAGQQVDAAIFSTPD